MINTCSGCGVELQNTDKTKAGYTPKEINHQENVLCQRCFRLQHYHEITPSTLKADDFLSILQDIATKDCLIVYMIDIFDFNGSLITGLTRHLNGHDILVLANKRDILPKIVKDNKIIHWLKKQLKDEGLKPVDIILTSALKNYQMDDIMKAIAHFRKKRDVYVIGTTNVGKSTFINSLLKHYSNEKEALVTTSEFPGTTLGMIEIPLDDHSSLFDTPGIMNARQMSSIIDVKDLKLLLPQKELFAAVYQLEAKQTIYIGGLARFDFIVGEKTSFVCYFPELIKLHRTKLEKADDLYNRHMTLKPEIESIPLISDMKKYEFRIKADEKVDIIVSGLGFITISGNNQIVRVHAPKGIAVFLRKALI